MSKRAFSALGLVLIGVLVFAAGWWAGRTQTLFAAGANNWMMNGQFGPMNGQYGPMMGNAGMMNGQYGSMIGNARMMNGQYGSMMGNAGMMNGQCGSMMGNAGMMNGQHGSMMGNAGMMNGQHGSMMGMMTGFGVLADIDPLTVEGAESAVEEYLSTLGNDDLAIGEIMIFDNHAYAQVIDTAQETGAFELLVDPVSGQAFPEPGPNMMWNTTYGMMAGNSGNNMMNGRGMMGSFGYTPDVEISVTAQEAVALAQDFLDDYQPGKMANETADRFPGYYTLHVLEDGEITGMLSVNAYSGQVFLHHWHGEFIEMISDHHD